jgi:hypothetical protein
MAHMSPAWVLDEDDALELLAYLVTAARTQVDEAAEYGPMRLLTAARRLADMMGPRASDGTRQVVTGPLQAMPLLAVPRSNGGSLSRAEYVAAVDGLCREVAELLTARFTTAEAST